MTTLTGAPLAAVVITFGACALSGFVMGVLFTCLVWWLT